MAAVWSCRTCGIGWLSEPALAAPTWYLYALTKPGDGSSVNQSEPAWTLSGPSPSICPASGLSRVQERQPAQAQLNYEEVRHDNPR
jgi:hypothetical protein